MAHAVILCTRLASFTVHFVHSYDELVICIFPSACMLPGSPKAHLVIHEACKYTKSACFPPRAAAGGRLVVFSCSCNFPTAEEISWVTRSTARDRDDGGRTRT